VSDCCTPKGYRQIFSEKSAGRFRRKGLDRMSRRIADLLKAQQVTGRTLLEVGGGVGAIEIELIRAGIARAVNVELTSESDPESWNCRLRASRVSWSTTVAMKPPQTVFRPLCFGP